MNLKIPDFKPLDSKFLDIDYEKMIKDIPSYEESIPYEQSENQIKLLNQIIELQNKSILENQKTSDKTLRQNRVLIVLGSLTLLVALAVPIVLALLGN